MKKLLCTTLLALTMGLAGCTDSSETRDPLPKADVEILIDDAGIPHIYAQDDEDLFFAYGYQLATDRLLQLALFRRYAYGRLAEVLGPEGPGSVGDTALRDDMLARLLNFKHYGKLDAELMKSDEPEHYMLTSAWVAGINKRVDEIQKGQAPRPLEFGADHLDFVPEKWADEDVYVIQKMVNFGLDLTLEFEVLLTLVDRLLTTDAPLQKIELFRPARPIFTVPEDERPGGTKSAMSWIEQSSQLACHGVLSPDAPNLDMLSRMSDNRPLGSNNWAVAKEHSDTGAPILSGDPHLGYNFSGIVYGLHLNSKDAGGSFNTTGFSFVGAPGIFAGHNDKVAYTETSAFADVMDIWAVDISDGKANVGGMSADVVEREEIIAVKGGEPEVFVFKDVVDHGIIVPPEVLRAGTPPIADGTQEAMVGWTGFTPRPARYFRELMRVENIDEFEAAVDRMGEMTYNFVAADADDISYRVGVDIPARNTPAPGRLPWQLMDGSDPQALWPEGQFLTGEQKPRSRGETNGYIVTANNDPFGHTADGDATNDPFYYGAFFPPGWRASRIDSELQRLIADGPVSIEQMQALQMDSRSNLADDLLPVLLESYGQIGTDTDLAAFEGRADLDSLVELLTVDWNREMKRDSAGALAFHAFAHFLAREVLEDDLSIFFGIIMEAAPMYLLKVTMLALTGQYATGDAAVQQGQNVAVLNALDTTSAFLVERFGSVDSGAYRYADMRVSDMDYAYGRPVEVGKYPTDGGESSVNVAQSTFFEPNGESLDQWVSHWGPVERQVMSFDANGTPYSHANFALGNVADPSSPHFDDAMEDWVEGNYRKLLFDRAEIDAATETRVVLSAK